jgi:hypothetical protein
MVADDWCDCVKHGYVTTTSNASWDDCWNSMKQDIRKTSYGCDTTTTGSSFATYKRASYGGVANPYSSDVLKITAGVKTIELPDGAKLIVDDLGNYRIEDRDAKVTYKANRVREFSPHLNASDMLAEFVKYVGGLGVRQSELLNLPIELFINWLVIEAAERDQDPIPADVVHPTRHQAIRFAIKPQCRTCGRFISHKYRDLKFPFCNVEHAQRYIARRSEIKRIQGIEVVSDPDSVKGLSEVGPDNQVQGG